MDTSNLKKVIQEANPEIMELEIHKRCPKHSLYPTAKMQGCICSKKERSIRLADVLIAYGEKYNLDKDKEWRSNALQVAVGMTKGWNLKDNNLDNQSDECKKFLIKLLVK